MSRKNSRIEIESDAKTKVKAKGKVGTVIKIILKYEETGYGQKAVL